MTNIIDLIATGSKKDVEALEKAIIFIESIGFQARVSPTIFGQHPLYVNSDDQRLQNLTRALYAEDSEIVWCLRGGSGTSRLLPSLDAMKLPLRRKLVIGLSDVTALLLFLSNRWGWKVVHGPTAHYVALNKLTPDALDAIVQVIQGTCQQFSYHNLVPLNAAAQTSQTIEGILTGGNMSLVQQSLATSWQIQSQDKILFFEDVNEQPYRIAERLEHLRQAGVFRDAKAVLFGDFTHEDPQINNPELLVFALEEFAKRINIPCLSNLPAGHKDFCKPLLMNANARLIIDGQGNLIQDMVI